jgi:hypothetical protein
MGRRLVGGKHPCGPAVQEHHGDVGQRIRVRLIELEPTGHAQQIIHRNVRSRIRGPAVQE